MKFFLLALATGKALKEVKDVTDGNCDTAISLVNHGTDL